MDKIKERNKGLNLRREHGQQMLEGWNAHGVSMFQIAARRRQHTSWAVGMVKDSGAEAQWPAQMQQHAGGHGGGLGGMYDYTAHVCGDVGGIGGASLMMELLGQPAMALTADHPAQGLAQAQEVCGAGVGAGTRVRGEGAGASTRECGTRVGASTRVRGVGAGAGARGHGAGVGASARVRGARAWCARRGRQPQRGLPPAQGRRWMVR